jgi:hypothetical protein
MKIFFILLLLINTHILVSKETISPNEIVKKADLKRGLGNVSHTFMVDVKDQDGKKESFKVQFKDVDHTLSEQVEPLRAKGRKLLMREYDLWLFTPNTKKAIRISLEQKLSGMVSNGDIARTNYAQDYEATFITDENDKDKDNYHLELLGKNKKVTYAKIHYVVKRKDFAPVEAIFYAISGKALKRAKFGGFKDVLGVSRSTQMLISDYIQKDKYSVMFFYNHHPETLGDELFNKERLEF